jgi:hypothetical protein
MDRTVYIHTMHMRPYIQSYVLTKVHAFVYP